MALHQDASADSQFSSLFFLYTEPNKMARLPSRAAPTVASEDLVSSKPNFDLDPATPKAEGEEAISALEAGDETSVGTAEPGPADAPTGADAGADVDASESNAEVEGPSEDVTQPTEDALPLPDKACLQVSAHSMQAAGASQPSVYFVRKAQEPVQSAHVEDQLEMGKFTEADSLQLVTRLFEQVYIPMLAANIPEPDQLVKTGTLSAADAETKIDSDLLAALQKFLNQANTSATHLSGNVQLSMPDLPVELSDERDDDILQTLESVVHEWSQTLQAVKQQELGKTAGTTGPMDEILYWNERNNVLGSLHEQVGSVEFQAIVRYALALLQKLASYGRVGCAVSCL